MRKTRLFALLIAISTAFLFAQTDPPGRIGRLNYINGPVSFQPAGVADWVDAYVNRPLTLGDQVWVGGGGRAEIHVGSTALRLDSNTALQFLNLDDQTIQIQLSQGTLTVRVRNVAQNQNIELDTPGMAFTVLRPGGYRIDADPDSQTTSVTVRAGEGEVTGGGRTFPVQAGQQAIMMGDDQISYRLVSAPRPDGWDQWTSSRDLREDRSLSARYVSREMEGYEDLDQYGGWSSQSGYGQVWMPTSVSAGWAPYHDGHWAWISPWGWTWVDDAPWGFAPYHYGRWASFSGRWGWIPGPYGVTPLYAPALVGWIGGGRGGSGFSLSFSFGNSAAVGWFPLGPREPYFPAYGVSSGYFGRVNNTNTVINTTTINNYYNDSRNSNNSTITNIRYANQSVPNAVMAVPQDRFANGRRVTESSRTVSAEQLGSARTVAAPEIAPQRVSVLGPRAAEAPRASRPPANAMSRPVVARTAPPPAPVPFERQQAELNQNPGRPVPAASVQQMRQNAPARSAPVRVVDMGKVERIQPKVGARSQPEGVRQVSPAAAATSQPTPQPPKAQERPSPISVPANNDRSSGSPSNPAGRQNGRWSAAPSPDVTSPQQNEPSPGVNRRRQNAPPAAEVQQPAPQRPSASPTPAYDPSSNGAGTQNDRRSAPVARPVAPQVDVNPPRQNTPPANVNRRQRDAPPAAEVQQPEVAPARPDKPQAQAQQANQSRREEQQPRSRRNAPKGKPGKEEEKK